MIEMNQIDRIESVLEDWFFSKPFYAHMLMSFNIIEYKKSSLCNVVPDEKKTMAVFYSMGRFNLTYDEIWTSNLSDSELKGVLIHEIKHILEIHLNRVGKRNRELWNIANDMVINYDIIEDEMKSDSSISLPEKGAYLHEILPDYKGPIISEAIYEQLKKKDEAKADNGGNGFGEGSPCFDNHEGLDSLSEEELKEVIEKISDTVQEALSKEIESGKKYSLSKSTLEKIEVGESERRHKINYENNVRMNRKKIHAMLTNAVGSSLSPLYTWSKANRRDLPLKGKTKRQSPILCCVDVSGSCFSEDILSVFRQEIKHLSKRGFEIRILFWDTDIVDDVKYTSKVLEQFPGGGGTDVQCVFDHIEENKLQGYNVFIFTDGEFNRFIDTKGIKPLWLLTEGYEDFDVKGKKLKLELGFNVH